MSLRYQGRHRAPSSVRVPTVNPTLGVTAVAAVGLVAPLATATTAQAAPAATTIAKPAVTAPAKVTTRPFTGVLKQGSRGTLVKTVQRKVGATADGVYGSRTRAKVASYQRKKGLKADGVVGPKTARVMKLTVTTKATPARSTKKAASRSTSRTAVSGNRITRTAAGLLGRPYRYGATGPSSFDCSGFTGYVFKKNGINLPRTAEQQRRAATRVSSPKPGDLVFFGAPAHHVGIYAGNGQIYDAGRSGGRTSKRKIWTNAVSYGRVS